MSTRQYPTLPGKVDGIISWDPLKLQCRNCGRIFTGHRKSRATDLILSGFGFHICDGKTYRMCPECLAAAKAGCEKQLCVRGSVR